MMTTVVHLYAQGCGVTSSGYPNTECGLRVEHGRASDGLACVVLSDAYGNKNACAACISARQRGPEAVNHPAHYNQGKFEVIDVIDDWKLGFNDGNAVKYIARARYKGKHLEDLKKARWYLNREISNLEKSDATNAAD